MNNSTPSPQPQPDGDWATKATQDLLENGFTLTPLGIDPHPVKIADIIRRHCPAPAPAANEGAVNELVEACEPFVVLSAELNLINFRATVVTSPIEVKHIHRLAKAAVAVKAGGR
jgi:hypothetical protein